MNEITKSEKKRRVSEEILHRQKAGLPLNYKTLRDEGGDAYRLYKHARIAYGSWCEALEASGIKYNQVRAGILRFPDKDSVIAEIKRRQTNGLPLTAGSLSSGKAGDKSLYDKGRGYFGSWKAAILASGLGPEEVGLQCSPFSTRESVDKEMLRRKRKGLSLSSNAIKKAASPLYYGAVKQYGSWRSAIETVGLSWDDVKSQQKKYPTKKSVVDELKNRKKAGLSLSPGCLQKTGANSNQREGSREGSARDL